MANERSPLLPKGVQEAHNNSSTVSADHGSSSSNHSQDSDGGDGEQPLSQPSIALAPIIIPMALGIFLAAMDQTIVLSTYAAIGSELNQLQSTSWIATGYMLTLASCQPLYGKLSDIFGRKSCLLFAYTVFSLGCVLCGLARSMNELIAARAIAGVGGGGMTTVVSIVVTDVVPLRSRGTWQGILNLVFATGSAVGAPLGGLLADNLGWRWAFLIQVPATILAIITVSVSLHLPKSPVSDFQAKLKRVDFVGAISLFLTVFFLLFGLDRGGNVSWKDSVTIAALSLSLILSILFSVVETMLATEPCAPIRIILNRSLIASYIVNFFGLGTVLATVFHISLYLQAVLDKAPSEVGLWLLPSIAGGVCGSIAGGLIMQSTGKYYILTVGSYSALLAGIVLVSLTTGVVIRSSVGMAMGLALASLGNGSGITTTLTDIIANAGTEDQAVAIAVSYLYRSLGSVVMVSVGSSLIQNNLRKILFTELTGHDVDEIIRRVRESLSYINELDPETGGIVRGAYDQAIHTTLWFNISVAGCAVLASFYIREKSLSR